MFKMSRRVCHYGLKLQVCGIGIGCTETTRAYLRDESNTL